MNNWFKIIVDCLFPEVCLNCKTLQKESICKNCIDDTFKYSKNHSIQLTNNVKATYLLNYECDIIKQVLYLIKYQAKKNLATQLSSIVTKLYSEKTTKIIIPIPGSLDRETERGFDHISILFSDFWISKKQSWFPCLKRVTNTPALNKLNKKERQSLLKNIFAPNNDYNCSYLKGKNILIVDDIITTGTSMKEAIQILKKYNPLSISALSICHASLNNKR